MPEPEVLDLDAAGTVRFLNRLRRRRVIRDYVIVGGVAALRYTAPRATKDVDAMVLVDDLLREYGSVWSRILAEAGGVSSGQLIYVTEADTWIDVLATGGSPFFEEVLRTAELDTVAPGVRGKFARPECLILMSLEAWRPDPDYSRVATLYQIADRRRLDGLLRRYDSDGKLTRRLNSLLQIGGV